ncbi:MAG TPA: GMC oxidoreductase [Rhizomicrobium sp.]|jgi:cholesterol oxidase|nr:GMC oxidoreductase [Rhizomicrobium sp.]
MSEKSAIDQAVDVAVIGSGFGGAAVACRLAQAGYSVAVLEQGKEYPTGRGEYDVTGNGIATVRHGHFWVDIGYGMNVVRGIGVGGGSLHYFGVRLRTRPEIFEDPRWPASITREVLDPYYDLAGEMLPAWEAKPHPVVGPSAHGEAFMAAARECRRCKSEPRYVPIAVNTGREPVPTHAGVPQTRCTYCGECLIGCPPSQSFVGNVNARGLLTLNYLAVARQHGAVIYPQHRALQVRKVQAPDGYDFRVDVAHLRNVESEESERTISSGVLRAKRAVLAGGTMGTVDLLLKSKDFLPEMSSRIGHYFSGNGDFLIPKTVGTPMNLRPTSGPTITAGADFSTDENWIYIEDLGLIPFAEAILGTRAISVAAEDPYQMGYLGMGTDAANGILALKDGRLRLFWDPTKSMGLYTQITEALREMSQMLGGTYAKPETYNPIIGTGLITAHPLGGAVLSDTAETGVVDQKGEVHGVGGLFVADGSLMPTALATNPSYTITALAERVAFWMINDRDMKPNDPARPKNP